MITFKATITLRYKHKEGNDLTDIVLDEDISVRLYTPEVIDDTTLDVYIQNYYDEKYPEKAKAIERIVVGSSSKILKPITLIDTIKTTLVKETLDDTEGLEDDKDSEDNDS